MIDGKRLQRNCAALLAAAVFGSGCTSGDKNAKVSPSDPLEKKDAISTVAPVDVSFLLSMSFLEAQSISTQQLEFSPQLKIAADSIQVSKYTADGKPRKAHVRGKVFLEMNFGEPAKALCQEAFITEDDLILRGKPILQRGGSMVEGLDDRTVFYLFGSTLRVIGRHQVTPLNESAALLPALDHWVEGPNPLLPPLTEDDVPIHLRREMQQATEPKPTNR